MMESFYCTLKKELIQNAKFEIPKQTQMEIFNKLNYIIILSACILHWAIFLLYNLRKRTHKISLTLCLKNVGKLKNHLAIKPNLLGAHQASNGGLFIVHFFLLLNILHFPFDFFFAGYRADSALAPVRNVRRQAHKKNGTGFK